MFFLIKTAIGAVVLAIVAYGVFLADMGGKTLFGHASEVWNSPVVQTKVEAVRDGVKNELEDRLAEAAERAALEATSEKLGSPNEFEEEDRKALEAMLDPQTAQQSATRP